MLKFKRKFRRQRVNFPDTWAVIYRQNDHYSLEKKSGLCDVQREAVAFSVSYTSRFCVIYCMATEQAIGRPRRRWEDNIKTDLQDVGCGDTHWTELVRIGTGGGRS